MAAKLWEVARKPTLSLGPSLEIDRRGIRRRRSSTGRLDRARGRRLRSAKPVLCVDTGMQRFACPPRDVEAVMQAGEIDEAFTHATRMEHVALLSSIVGGRRFAPACGGIIFIGRARRAPGRSASGHGDLSRRARSIQPIGRGPRWRPPRRIYRIYRGSIRNHSMRVFSGPSPRSLHRERPATTDH